jgi:hypothetical protein
MHTNADSRYGSNTVDSLLLGDLNVRQQITVTGSSPPNAYGGVYGVYVGDQRPTAGSYRDPQFRANPALPDTTRHSKPARMADDVHLPALTIIT